MEERNRRRRSTVLFRKNKFYSTTTLPGFGLIQASNSKIETIFWYLILLIFAGITIRNAIALTHQFTSKATVTRVTMGKLGTHHRLGVFQMRLQIVLPELNPEYENITYPFKFEAIYNRSLHSELEEALEKLPTKETLLTSSWDYILLTLMTRYVTFMSNCEYLNEICNTYNIMEMPFKIFMYEAIIHPDLTKIREGIQKLLNHAKQLQVTEKELTNKFGREILDWAEFQMTDPEIEMRNPGDLWKIWKLRLISILQGREMGSVIVFYEMNRTQPIGVGLDYGFRIDANLHKLERFLIQTEVLGSNSTPENAMEWYKQYKPEIMIYYGNDATIPLRSPMGFTKFWTVKISSSFHSIENCYHNYSKLRCTYDCTWKKLYKQCKCIPIFIETQDPSLLNILANEPTCTMNEYKYCFENYDGGNIRLNCVDSCSEGCHYDFYEIPNPEVAETKLNEMAIAFFILNNEHPIFQEKYSQSWQSFLAELGGACDFWLGANVIAFLHMLTYFFKQVVYYCCPKKRKEFNRNHSESGEFWETKEQNTNVVRELLIEEIFDKLQAKIIELEVEIKQLKNEQSTNISEIRV